MAVLVIGNKGCQLGTPFFRALFFSAPSLLCSSRLVFWAGCLQPCNFTLVYYGSDIRGEMNSVSCMRVCLPLCVSVRVCACVRSQHMLSSVYREVSRACDAVRAGWGHSTSSVNTSPEWMRGSPFWAPRNRWERGELIPTSIIHTVSPPNLRAWCQKWTICSVPGGRCAIIFSCFLVPLLVAASVVWVASQLCDVCELSASLSLC